MRSISNMIIWGKLIGAMLGFAFYGPPGFILGLVLGHVFDRGLAQTLNTQGHTAKVRLVFFRTVFQTMGCLAKADGVVSENEIRAARNIMLHDFNLSNEQMMAAIGYFNEGKQNNFDLGTALNKFRLICDKQPDLRRYFLELIVKAAIADKVLWPAILGKLQFICTKLNVPVSELEYQLRTYNFSSYAKQKEETRYAHDTPLAAAYRLLGVKETDDVKTIKTAYRKLMNKYHPDKLIAKGLPTEMINTAQEKAAQISAAYDLIMQKRS